MFNKRHYEAIALVMQQACPDMQPNVVYEDDVETRQEMWNDMTNWLADMFERDNRLFKRDRFIGACQPGANVKAHCEKLIRQGLTPSQV